MCRATVEFWRKFADHQHHTIDRLGHKLKQGTIAFRKTLDLYEAGCGGMYDVWVAYVTNLAPTTIAERSELVPKNAFEGAKDETNIEMAVTVLVHRETPVTSHVGIFRTYPFWTFDPPSRKNRPMGHKGISPLIHAFAAGSALYPSGGCGLWLCDRELAGPRDTKNW